MSWNFEDNFTQAAGPSKTQHIDIVSTSSESEEDEDQKAIRPTQKVAECSDNEQLRSSSPVFHSKKRRTLSPVFPSSQSLLDSKSKRTKRALLFMAQKNHSSGSEDLFADSQRIDSDPSSLSQAANVVKCSSGESNVILSTSSSASNNAEASNDDWQIHEKLMQQALQSSKKKSTRKRRKKHGLAEQLDKALKKLVSDRVLRNHLPQKLLAADSAKHQVMKAKVLSKSWHFSMLLLKCVDFQLDPNTGEKLTFLVIVDNILDLGKKVGPGCEIMLEGPWLEFKDDQGQKVLTHVSKILVIVERNE